MKPGKRVQALLGAAVLSASVPLAAELEVHYHERAPYMVSVAPGIVAGYTGTPATRAFQSAGVAHQWRKTPSKRQLAIVRRNNGRHCAVGWFKNPEREAFARFTRPIYKDEERIALALAGNDAVQGGQRLQELFRDDEVTLLLKAGYSYGQRIDELIDQLDPEREIVTLGNEGMLEILRKGRADYFFMAEREADELIARSDQTRERYKYVRFSNMPAGKKRYIMCSKRVSPSVIERLNDWIAQHVDLDQPDQRAPRERLLWKR